MSWTNVSAPIQPTFERVAPAYRKEGLEWVWKDATPITSTSDNAGRLVVVVNSTQAARLTVGDYVYVNILENANLIPTPFVQVFDVSGSNVTLDVAYSASYIAESPELRFFFPAEFVIKTGEGITESRFLETNLLSNPNRECYYAIDVKRAAVARYVFGEPNPQKDKYYRSVLASAYPVGETIAQSVALKQNTGVTIPNKSAILYNNVQNIVSTVFQNRSNTALTYTAPVAVENEGFIEVHVYKGQAITVTFTNPLDDINFIPVTNPTGLTYTSSGGGLLLTGLTGTITQTGSFDQNLEYSDGSVLFNIRWVVHEPLALRERCSAKSVMVVFWDRLGGWKQYSFDHNKKYSIQGAQTNLVRQGTDKYVVGYEESQEALKVTARPESEAILDYLNTVRTSTEIFEVIYDAAGIITGYRRMYINRPDGNTKEKPYKSVKNIWQMQFVYSEEILSINED